MEPGKFPSITGGYGKCRASFIDRQGKIQVYNKGTIGKGGCSATDDNDKYLFQEIPY